MSLRLNRIVVLLSAILSGARAAAGPSGTPPSAPAPRPPAVEPTTSPPVDDLDAPTTPEEAKRMAERAVRIAGLIAALESAGPDEREKAGRDLLEIGAPARPFIEAALRKKNVMDLARVYIRLHRPDDEPFFTAARFEARLPRETAPTAIDPKTAAAIERYVHGKYREASGLYRDKRYGRALDLVNALVTLEPQSAMRTKLNELRTLCEHRQLQRDALVTALVPVKEEITIGDEIAFRLRLENITPFAVRLAFGSAAAEAGGGGDPAATGLAVADVQAVMCDPLGLRRIARRFVDWKVPRDIVIHPRQVWEQRVVVRSNEANEESDLDPTMLRVYEVAAHPVAARLWIGDQIDRRRVVFEACTVRAWPKGVKWRAEEPLACLGKTLDDMNATLNDLFMAALRVPKKDADKAANLLVRALPRMPDPVRQVIMECLKELTGLEFGHDVKKWLDWGQVDIEKLPSAPAPKPSPGRKEGATNPGALEGRPGPTG